MLTLNIRHKMKKIPQEHQDLVMARVEESIKNPGRLLDWDEVSEKLGSGGPKKPFDAKKFTGALKVDEDASAIQKRLKDE